MPFHLMSCAQAPASFDARKATGHGLMDIERIEPRVLMSSLRERPSSCNAF